ncbi:MAG: PAS domain-containing sensor histidine kinase, partial [Desulfovibrio sp.]
MRNPFSRKAEQENARATVAFPASIPKIGFLLQILIILTVLGSALSWYFIDTAAQEERRHMIAAMQGRAEALAGAVEGSARFLGYGSGGMLAEMARQPGIAWIAIVDSEGYIIQDSNFGLDGKRLYTEKELAQLAPGTKIQGRFSPDDPAIYETWKSFAPQRLRGRHCREDKILRGLNIFIGQDAQNFTRRLDEYVNRLRLLSTMIILAVLFSVSLMFLLQRYHSSRRQLADTQALAEQVIRNYPAAMIVTDANGKVNLCNEPGRMLLGDEKGKSPKIADLPAIDWQNLKKALDSGEVILEKNCDIFRSDAPPLPVSISAARIFDSSGILAGYLIVARDRGEIRKLENKLRKSERLSSL